MFLWPCWLENSPMNSEKYAQAFFNLKPLSIRFIYVYFVSLNSCISLMLSPPFLDLWGPLAEVFAPCELQTWADAVGQWCPFRLRRCEVWDRQDLPPWTDFIPKFKNNTIVTRHTWDIIWYYGMVYQIFAGCWNHLRIGGSDASQTVRPKLDVAIEVHVKYI